MFLNSQTDLSVGGLNTCPADSVPATEGVSGQDALSTGPIKRAVCCWDPHHAFRCAHIDHTLQWDRTPSVFGNCVFQSCPSWSLPMRITSWIKATTSSNSYIYNIDIVYKSRNSIQSFAFALERGDWPGDMEEITLWLTLSSPDPIIHFCWSTLSDCEIAFVFEQLGLIQRFDL